jgi:hypothetical protein
MRLATKNSRLMTAKTSEYDRDLNAGWLEVVGDITQFG